MTNVIPMTEPGQELERHTPQALVRKLRDDTVRAEIAQALPPTVTVERFTRAAQTAFLQNPELAECDEGSVFRSLVKCAMDGLLPDGREAALVAYYNNKAKRKEAQYLPMIFGVRKIAGEAGWTIHTFVIYANDEFEVDLGGGLPIHRPARLGSERGAMVGAWAKATHKDGRASVIEVMRAEDIRRSQAVSKTGDKDFSPWKTWTDRMWEKTVGHRIAKKLPLSAGELERLERVLDATEDAHVDPAEMLYGSGASFAELPAGSQPAPNPPAGDVAPGAPAASKDDDATGGGGEEPPSEEPAAAASPAPGVDVEEAMLAADYVPPVGKYTHGGEQGPRTLAEIHEAGDDAFLRAAAARAPDEVFRAKAAAYVAVYLDAEAA